MQAIRTRLTYANVVSSLCLFLLVSGGVAVAATHLSKNSVGRNQLKAGSVTSGKIAKGAVHNGAIKNAAVSSAKLGNGSVSATKLKPSAVNELALGNGAVSAAKLGDGSVVASKLATPSVVAVVVSVAAGDRGLAEAKCPSGAALVGGGGGWGNLGASKDVAEKARITSSTPIQVGAAASGWSVEGFNGTAATLELFARAVCVPGGSASAVPSAHG